MNIAGETITNSSAQSSQVQSDWTQATTTALDYIKNKPVLATVATTGSYVDLTNKPNLATVATTTTIDLTNTGTYLTTRFYPIVISQTGMYRYDIAVDMPPQGLAAAYNAHWIQGWVQAGGWSDQLPRLFELAHGYFDGNERSILGVYVGSQSFAEGVVVYVRGGGTYLIKTPATSVVAYSAPFTSPGTNFQSTFAIKDGNGVDVLGTTTNAIQLFYGTTSTTGTYKSGVHVIQNVNSSYGFAATTGSFATDTTVQARINGGDIVLDTGFDGNGPVWLQARRLSNFVDKFSLVLNPNGGNVGIGVNPTAALDIVDQNNGIIQFSEYNATDGVAIRARRARGTIAAPTAVAANDTLVALRGFGYNSTAFSGRCVGIEMAAAETFTATATGTYMGFHTCASTTTTNSEKVRILGNGNVGIGTTSPGCLLDFNSTTVINNINKVISFYGNPASTPETATDFTGFGVITGTTLRYQTSSSTAGGHVWYMGATEAMRITISSGAICLGIGKYPSGYQLDLSTDGARKLTTTTWTTGSDQRIKTDIQSANLQMCYETIKTIDLKYFKWNFPIESNVSVDDKHSLGFIAQDVKAVFPNAVRESNSYGFTDFLSLNTDQILKAMYGALRQTMADKESLETKLETAQNDIKLLAARLTAIEALIGEKV